MRKSTTRGDIIEWTRFVSVFLKCCNKCCGLTNCLKQTPRGLLQQIKSSISRLGRGGTYKRYWQSIRWKEPTDAVWFSFFAWPVESSFWVCRKVFSRNVWNNSCRVFLSLRHLGINALPPSFPVNVLTHTFNGRYLYWKPSHFTPIPLCPCNELKVLSKQEATSGLKWTYSWEMQLFSHRSQLFRLKSLRVVFESFLGQVPMNALSDELLLGFVKGHFHPSEHICIQSEGRENMFHTNCLLFYCRG